MLKTEPMYLYSRRVLTERVELIRKLLPGVDLRYSVKANPNREVLRHLGSLGLGFDVSSREELSRAVGEFPSEITFTGPGKTANEIRFGASASNLIIDSDYEVTRLGVLPSKPVYVRVNPQSGAPAGSGQSMGGPSQFGVDEVQLPTVVSDLRDVMGKQVAGFHIFGGSQNLSADSLIEYYKGMFETFRRHEHLLDVEKPKMLFGAGWGIPYHEGQEELDVVRVCEYLREEMSKSPDTEFSMELGRWLVGPAGRLILTVVDVKISYGKKFAVCNGGMNVNLAATGGLGQVVRRPYPIKLVRKAKGVPLEEVTVVGPLCTPLDSFGKVMLPADIGPGDLVEISQSGAYGLSASTLGFLSHKIAHEQMEE